MARQLEHGAVESVEEVVAGDELAVDAPAGSTALVVGDAADFDEDGGALAVGTEVLGYSGADLDTDTLTLTDPTVGAYVAGEPVNVSPEALERVAMVRLDVDGEGVAARVPHALYDRVPEGVRDPGQEERVSLTLDGGEWVVADVLGREPSIDGSLIDPATMPPPVTSDGLAPEASPDPTVIGGVGVLHVRWVAGTNPDPLTYDVHVSTVDGFTHDTSTLAASTPGTAITLRSLPDGTPLAYGVTYYVRLVARDEDGAAPSGAQASGALHQVGQEEISAGYAYLGEVSADQIITGTLDAEVTISGLFQTSPSGRRVVMDAEGIHLFDSADNSLVDLPTDTSKAAQFKGTAELDTATVKSGLSLQKPAEVGKAAATVQPGGSLHLANGVQPPGSAPAVLVHLNNIGFSGLADVGAGASWHYNDMHADATYVWVASADPENTLRVHRIDRATATVTRTANPAFTSTQLPASANQASLTGITRLGTTFYLCLLTSAAPESGTYRVIGFTDDTFTTQTGPEWTVSASAEQVVGLHADGTSVWVASLVGNRDATFGRYRVRQLTASTMAVAGGPWDDNSGQLFRNNAKGDTGAIRGGLYYGTAGGQWATPRVVAHGYDEAYTRVYTIGATDLVRQPDDEWPLGRNGPHTWDGTRFLQMSGSSTKATGSSDWQAYSNLRWTTESPTWWASYAWLNVAQNKRTPQSPRTSFTMVKRRFVTLTGEDVPLTGAVDDPDSARHYLGRGATDPGVAAMYAAGDGGSVTVADSFAFAGENPVTTTGFASGAASDLHSGALRRDGAPLVKVASDGKANVDGLIPPGTINMWAGDTAPTGWALCDGTSLNTATTPDLFNAIGYKFGGSGTTYYVPDLRGRFPLGASPAALKGSVGDFELGSQGSTPGVAGDPGRLTHRHTHTIAGQAVAAAWSVANGSLGEAPRRTAFEGHNHGGTTGQAGVGPSLTSNLEYHGFLTLNFIIKL